MKETLETINRMQSDGVIGKYAIGGAVAATFYLEPAATLDLDIFVFLPQAPETTLVSLSSIYTYLTALGCKSEGEHIIIFSWPVQFLIPGNALEQEAVSEAQQTDVDGTPTWVLSAEHLAAIALQTGRTKDHFRILQLLEQNAVSRDKLDQILARHGMIDKWKQFQQRYLDGQRKR